MEELKFYSVRLDVLIDETKTYQVNIMSDIVSPLKIYTLIILYSLVRGRTKHGSKNKHEE